MSCPLLMRSVAAMPRSSSTFVKASIRSTDGRRKPPAPGLYGMRFTCASFVGPCRTIAAARARAVPTESLTPASSTYWRVTFEYVLLDRIIDPGEQHVLERDAPLRALHVPRRGGEDLLDAPFPIDRHDPRARRIVRRVERDREVDREAFAAERIDARHDPARRDGQPSRADAELLRIGERAHRRERRVVVVERLPHPHVHDVGHPLATRRELALPGPDLVDDRARG